MWKIADLCAGVGGFHLAFGQLGVKTAVACEIDDHAQATYKYNFPETPVVPDIKEMKGRDLRGADILCAGFPCQAFSIAGYQKGFSDARGTIFFDIARIASEAEPEVLFLENVKNLSLHDKGKTFKVIRRILTDDLGYHISYGILDARDYGMFQMRERTVIVGFKNKKYWENFILKGSKAPPPEDFKFILEEFNCVDKKYFIKLNSHMNEHFLDKIKNKNNSNYLFQFRRHYWREYKGKCPTLTANMGTGGHNVPFIYDDRGPAPEGCTSYRKLMPIETFRLQGFALDGFNFRLPPDLPDSALYKQAGNSVPLCMIHSVAKNIINVLLNKQNHFFFNS